MGQVSGVDGHAAVATNGKVRHRDSLPPDGTAAHGYEGASADDATCSIAFGRSGYGFVPMGAEAFGRHSVRMTSHPQIARGTIALSVERTPASNLTKKTNPPETPGRGRGMSLFWRLVLANGL